MTTKKQFYESLEICNSLNSTLASVHSSDENAFIRSLAFEDRAGESELWLGGEQIVTGLSAYKWLDGSKFNYYNWSTAASEPNCRSRNVCCGLNLDRNGDWYDLPCSQRSLFLCQTFLKKPVELFRPDNYLMRLEQKLALISGFLESDRDFNQALPLSRPLQQSPKNGASKVALSIIVICLSFMATITGALA